MRLSALAAVMQLLGIHDDEDATAAGGVGGACGGCSVLQGLSLGNHKTHHLMATALGKSSS
jgi:hypothetical protein